MRPGRALARGGTGGAPSIRVDSNSIVARPALAMGSDQRCWSCSAAWKAKISPLRSLKAARTLPVPISIARKRSLFGGMRELKEEFKEYKEFEEFEERS